MNKLSRDSMRANFAVLEPKLPQALIPKKALTRVLATADLLPASCADVRYGFECPLIGDPLVDISFQLPPGQPWACDLAEWPIPADADREAWSTWRSFAAHWKPKTIAMAFAEFDTSASQATTPCLFWMFDRGSTRTEQMGALTSLLPDRVVERVAQVTAKLPECWQVRLVGTMLSRTDMPIRLVIGTTGEDAPTNVYSGFPGLADDPRVTEVVGRYAGHFEEVRLCIDLADKILPRVGFELMPADQGDNWCEILDQFVADGLTTPEAASAASGFVGATSPLLDAESCPPRLLRRWADSGYREVPYLVRTIHHAKLVFAPNKPTEAKIYLAVTPIWKRNPNTVDIESFFN